MGERISLEALVERLRAKEAEATSGNWMILCPECDTWSQIIWPERAHIACSVCNVSLVVDMLGEPPPLPASWHAAG